MSESLSVLNPPGLLYSTIKHRDNNNNRQQRDVSVNELQILLPIFWDAIK